MSEDEKRRMAHLRKLSQKELIEDIEEWRVRCLGFQADAEKVTTERDAADLRATQALCRLDACEYAMVLYLRRQRQLEAELRKVKPEWLLAS